MIKIYGIPNCDKMKKTFDILKSKSIEYTFFNYKKENLTPEILQNWFKKFTLNDLINKKGTTYKALTDLEKTHLEHESTAVELIISKPTLLKRPIVILENGDLILDFLERNK